MKLAFKLAFVFVVGISVSLILYGISRVNYSARLFERDSRRDLLAIGHTMAFSIAEVWQMEGREKAIRVLKAIDRKKDQLEIRWIDLDDLETIQLPEKTQKQIRERIKKGYDQTYITKTSLISGKRLFAYVPVKSDGSLVGMIELAESLKVERLFVEHLIFRTTTIILMIIVVCGAMALGFGYVMVGRPVRDLANMARRVGDGDLSGRLHLRQRDELGRLAVELNNMIERLSETRDKLESETRSRIAAMEQLRHADRLITVGQLSSGIAHELGTPLQVISGRSKMILRNELEETEERESIKIISEQTDKISSIIRQLLDFSRRKPSQRKANTDVRGIVEKVVEMLRPMALKRKVTLKFESPESPCNVLADTNQIQQVLTNVIVNGIHAIQKSGDVAVTVTHVRQEAPADIGDGETDYIVMRIADEGAGIPDDILPRIFEPFFTTKHVGEGTGLGLSVSYGIIRDHQGWIEVASEVNKGTVFSIFLPALSREWASP